MQHAAYGAYVHSLSFWDISLLKILKFILEFMLRFQSLQTQMHPSFIISEEKVKWIYSIFNGIWWFLPLYYFPAAQTCVKPHGQKAFFTLTYTLHLFCELCRFRVKTVFQSLMVDDITLAPCQKTENNNNLLTFCEWCGNMPLYHLPFKPTHYVCASAFT